MIKAESNPKGLNILELRRNPTRSVRIGSVSIGAAHPIAVQSMTATHTQDIDATVGQVNDLVAAAFIVHQANKAQNEQEESDDE